MLSRVKLTNARIVRGRPTLKNNTECFRNGLVRELKEKQGKFSKHSETHGPHRRNEKSECQECTCKIDKSLNRGTCIKFESREICVVGNQCDKSDFDFHNAEHKELPVIKICCDEGRDDCQQSKPKGTQGSFGTTVITLTILLILSILFRRVTVNVVVFVLRVVRLHVIVYMYIVTRYMYDARRRDFALSASFIFDCFDCSEVTIRKGNESIVQKENCFVGEIKEVELRSLRGKFILNRTYNAAGFKKVNHFSRRGRAPSRLPVKKLK